MVLPLLSFQPILLHQVYKLPRFRGPPTLFLVESLDCGPSPKWRKLDISWLPLVCLFPSPKTDSLPYSPLLVHPLCPCGSFFLTPLLSLSRDCGPSVHSTVWTNCKDIFDSFL